jgi:hypothetical protein
MRLTAPAISSAAVVLAVALVWYFRLRTEPPLVTESEATSAQPRSIADAPSSAAATEETAAIGAPPAVEARVVGDDPGAAPSMNRAPLPGETPVTPMANLLMGREQGPPPDLIEGEQEFAAEPVDTAWAPGAEADIFAKFAQMPGLKLVDLQVECRSTMCRLQLTQPRDAPAVEGGARPFNVLLDSVGLEPRWMIAIVDRSGTMKSVAYLWREGFGPPKPEQGQRRESN